jgi:hypothetical protein
MTQTICPSGLKNRYSETEIFSFEAATFQSSNRIFLSSGCTAFNQPLPMAF